MVVDTLLIRAQNRSREKTTFAVFELVRKFDATRRVSRLPALIPRYTKQGFLSRLHPSVYTASSTIIADMDTRTPYALSVLAPSQDGADESRVAIQGRLREFILAFQLDNSFIYR
jgi:hypothetical protein